MNTEKTSVNWYAHGARYYDPQLARWHSPDPLSELYASSSTYSYVRNNPVNFIDPNGMFESKGPSADERSHIREGITYHTSWRWNPGRPQFYSGADDYFLQYSMQNDASGGWRYDSNSETYYNAFGGGSVEADDFNRNIMPAYAELYYYDDGENRYVSESFLNVGMQSSSSFQAGVNSVLQAVVYQSGLMADGGNEPLIKNPYGKSGINDNSFDNIGKWIGVWGDNLKYGRPGSNRYGTGQAPGLINAMVGINPVMGISNGLSTFFTGYDAYDNYVETRYASGLWMMFSAGSTFKTKKIVPKMLMIDLTVPYWHSPFVQPQNP